MSIEISSNLSSLVLKYANWNTHGSIDQFQRWELREAISTLEQKYIENELSKDQLKNIKLIVDKVLSDDIFSWCKLSIVEEANLQYELKKRSIAIKCFGLNEFPQDIQSLKPYLEKQETPTHHVRDLININEIINWFKKWNGAILFCFSILYSIINFNPGLLLVSLFVCWVQIFIFEVLHHDYIAHGYITPKNKLIEVMLKIYVHAYSSNFERHKVWHMHHHAYWNTDKDIRIESIRACPWVHLMNVTINPDINVELSESIYKKADIIFKKTATPLDIFLNSYQKYIQLFVILSIWLFFGFSAVVYFYFMPWIWYVWWDNFADDFFCISNKQENLPWLYPLSGRNSYHYEHHLTYANSEFKSIEDLFFMLPPWVKYISPDYYFMKLFFKHPATK